MWTTASIICACPPRRSCAWGIDTPRGDLSVGYLITCADLKCNRTVILSQLLDAVPSLTTVTNDNPWSSYFDGEHLLAAPAARFVVLIYTAVSIDYWLFIA
jgi:hypothetical protein